eukprot:m.70222 g.70222  ORF g.70222 m.70222 type:complete len:72 (+) comp8631_c0_seq1:124-339(+)
MNIEATASSAMSAHDNEGDTHGAAASFIGGHAASTAVSEDFARVERQARKVGEDIERLEGQFYEEGRTEAA